MKKVKIDLALSISRQRSFHLLIAIEILYLILVTFEIPIVFHDADSGIGIPSTDAVGSLPRAFRLESVEDWQEKEASVRPRQEPVRVPHSSSQPSRLRVGDFKLVSSLVFAGLGRNGSRDDHGLSTLQKSARDAWVVGSRFWEEARSVSAEKSFELKKIDNIRNISESCPHSISLSGAEFLVRGRVMALPCGLTLGSHLAVVESIERI